jgi:hypothetical protein
MAKEKDPRLARAGVSGYNKPKRTPSHPTKSHVVVAKEGDKVKTIRFGQQGVSGDKKPTARQKSFKARHAKNIAKGKMSAAYWANKEKWWWQDSTITFTLNVSVLKQEARRRWEPRALKEHRQLRTLNKQLKQQREENDNA